MVEDTRRTNDESESGKSAPRQQLSEARVRSAIHAALIIDTAMDGIISMNESQNIVLFNEAAEKIFGWPADRVLGRSIDFLIPERFVANHRTYVEQFGQGIIQNRRMGVQRTVMALRATGEEFPIEASISQTSIDDERIYTAILRDVTEAVRRRQQIEQQSQMLDQVSDAISIVDVHGKITYWNHGAQTLFGWSADEAIGKDARELFYHGESEILSMILRETNLRGAWSGELTKTARSGNTVIVDHRRTTLRNNDGTPNGYLCIDIDITHRKKQERLSLRSQRLESIGTLAGGIAHDLNNVLTPILMGASLLASDRATANRQGLLDTLVASARRGAGLIQQLLAFAGGIQGERHPIQIAQLIEETRGLLDHTFPKSIEIKTKVAGDCPSVLGDPTELAQILMNLCINARDAMPDGGVLVVEAARTILSEPGLLPHPDARSGEYLILRVSDNGCGMSTEVLDRIFDPFFTTKEFGKGTGLGLATVQGIAKSYGGFVMVYSEVARGSTFSLFLPAAIARESVVDRNDELSVEAGSGRLVLLVDDELTIIQMTSAVLKSNGYQVVTASDGLSAVDIFSQRHTEISVVLLDMMMPGIDGLESLTRLRRIDPKVCVIACSGLRTSQREKDVIAAGAKEFLSKPYSDEQLLQSLARVLQI